jgi:hypothetical protein
VARRQPSASSTPSNYHGRLLDHMTQRALLDRVTALLKPRIYVIVEAYGSAYSLGESIEELIQHPLNRDGSIDEGGGGAVCWQTGIETDEERDLLRAVANALDALDTAAIGIRARGAAR